MSSKDIEQKNITTITSLVLEHLNISYTEKQKEKIFTPKSSALTKTISDIESIEQSWQLDTTNTSHSFGRKEKDEIIKLWSVPPQSAQLLESLIILTNSKTILEIGTSAGYAALHLAHGASINTGHLYTIEMLPEKAALAKENFQKSGIQNITLIEDEASLVLKNWNKEKIDFVFLDADKENYGKYFDLLLPIMNNGGLIVADNINDYGHLMEDYLQKVTGTHLPGSKTDNRVKSYYLAALDNGLMITQKISD